MRKNLTALLLLLAAIAWASQPEPPHQWEESWKRPFVFAHSDGFVGFQLEIECDRYRAWGTHCMGKDLLAEGRIRMRDGRLELLGKGSPRSYRVWGTVQHRVLEIRPTRYLYEVPSPITQPAFGRGKPASCLGIRPGMSLLQIPYPRVGQPGEHEFRYQVGTSEFLTVQCDASQRVECVSGPGLEIDGRPVLNARSQSRDLDALSTCYPGNLVGDCSVRAGIPYRQIAVRVSSARHRCGARP